MAGKTRTAHGGHGARAAGTIEGVDGLRHVSTCGHTGVQEGASLHSHKDGISAHVAIYLKPCVDIWQAYEEFKAAAVPGVHVEKIHVSLGEIDMLADVHADWTNPRGRETRLIGDWVRLIRLAKPEKGEDGDCECCYVARTSTNICMVPDP